MNQEFSDFLIEKDIHDIPDEAEESAENVAELFISFGPDFSRERINAGYLVTFEDARDFCSRDDTHGDGWLIGFFRR